MQTKRQIMSSFKKGFLDEVRKELQRYGNIVKDHSWSEPDGYYVGCHRVQYITHHSIPWKLHLWNGEVKSIGWGIEANLPE